MNAVLLKYTSYSHSTVILVQHTYLSYGYYYVVFTQLSNAKSTNQSQFNNFHLSTFTWTINLAKT